MAKALDSRLKRIAAVGDRSMTYIAAFPCATGIVMCADTLETEGDYKNYVEKLSVIDDLSYPLAVGGAGVGDLIDCSIDEIIERASAERPKTKKDLKLLIKNALKKIYEEDLPTLVIPKQFRTPQLLVSAKTDEGFVIFHTQGRRVLAEVEKAIIGYGTKYNNELLKRLHRPSLSMQQAVLLGVYLVSQSKKLDEGVGGTTRVAVVTQNGSWFDDPAYIGNSEARIAEFLRLTDDLFLSSVDISIPPSSLPTILEEFGKNVAQLREKYLSVTAALSFERVLTDPNYRGEPYPKIFPGATVSFGFTMPTVREQTPEETARNREMFRAMRESHNRLAASQFAAMIAGRQPLYLGKERIQVRGAAGPIPESASS